MTQPTTRDQLETIVGPEPLEGVASAREIGSRPLREGSVFEVQRDDGSVRIWQVVERTPTALDALTPLAETVARLTATTGSDARPALWPLERVERVRRGSVDRLLLVGPRVADNLAERLDDGWPATVADVTRVTTAVAGALAGLHANGIAHRALRPSSLLLGEGGAVTIGDYSRLAAFGDTGWPAPALARLAADGTPADGGDDALLLASVLFVWLTGRPLEALEEGTLTADRIRDDAWQKRPIRDADFRWYEELSGLLAGVLGGTPSKCGVDVQSLATGIAAAQARQSARRGTSGRLARTAMLCAILAALLLITTTGVGVGGRLRDDRRSQQLEPGGPANPIRVLLVTPSSDPARARRFERRALALEQELAGLGVEQRLHLRCVVARDPGQASRLARVCDISILPFAAYVRAGAAVDPSLTMVRASAFHYYSQVVARPELIARVNKALADAGQPVPSLPMRRTGDVVRWLQFWIDHTDRQAEMGTVRWAFTHAHSSAGHLVFAREVAAKLDPARVVAVPAGDYKKSLDMLLAGKVELAAIFANAGQESTSLEMLGKRYFAEDRDQVENLQQLAILTDRPIPNDVIAFRAGFDPAARERLTRGLLSLNDHATTSPIREPLFSLYGITGLQEIGADHRALAREWAAWLLGR